MIFCVTFYFSSREHFPGEPSFGEMYHYYEMSYKFAIHLKFIVKRLKKGLRKEKNQAISPLGP